MTLYLRKPQFIPLRFRFIGMTLSIAQSLSATSITDLLTYNYVALERSANQAAKGPDIIAVIFHDKEGRVAGFSGRPDLQNTVLGDQISLNALAASKPMIQSILDGDGKNSGIDIAIPIYPEGADIRWGTIRVQLSLTSMYEQIKQIQLVILMVGLIALIFGTVISIFAARRITGPLNNLMRKFQYHDCRDSCPSLAA